MGHEPGTTFDVGEGATFGRSDSADIRVDDPFASSAHARIFPRGEFMYMEDMGSTNGTYLNGRQVKTRRAAQDGGHDPDRRQRVPLPRSRRSRGPADRRAGRPHRRRPPAQRERGLARRRAAVLRGRGRHGRGARPARCASAVAVEAVRGRDRVERAAGGAARAASPRRPTAASTTSPRPTSRGAGWARRSPRPWCTATR